MADNSLTKLLRDLVAQAERDGAGSTRLSRPVITVTSPDVDATFTTARHTIAVGSAAAAAVTKTLPNPLTELVEIGDRYTVVKLDHQGAAYTLATAGAGVTITGELGAAASIQFLSAGESGFITVVWTGATWVVVGQAHQLKELTARNVPAAGAGGFALTSNAINVIRGTGGATIAMTLAAATEGDRVRLVFLNVDAGANPSGTVTPDGVETIEGANAAVNVGPGTFDFVATAAGAWLLV